jgi:thiamine pyrophosphokinase
LKATIIANGVLNIQDLHRIGDADLLIAADGGYTRCREHGLEPAVVIGDLDSLDSVGLDEFAGQVIRHSPEKDQTDLELALQYAVEQGAEQIDILAGLGNRWDQTVANVMLLTTMSQSVRLIDGAQELFMIPAGAPVSIDAAVGSSVSLIPLSDDVQGATTQGMKYALESEAMQFGKTRGVSNITVEETATVKISRGKLLCVLIQAK